METFESVAQTLAREHPQSTFSIRQLSEDAALVSLQFPNRFGIVFSVEIRDQASLRIEQIH